MMSTKHIVLTGPPGVGKTTLVKKIISNLQKQNVNIKGFYTEEQRSSEGKRIGFKIITVTGQHGQLASTSSGSRSRVGQYGVEVEQFERLALPELQDVSGKGVLIVDEIGKMELFSGPFKAAVTKAFASPNHVILATIPIKKGRPIEFVEGIRNHREVNLFTVDTANRNSLHETIIDSISQSLTKL